VCPLLTLTYSSLAIKNPSVIRGPVYSSLSTCFVFLWVGR
jgi:hypothetical protein